MTRPIVYLIESASESSCSMLELLMSHNITTKHFESAESFLDTEPMCPVGCILSDLLLPAMSGLELLQKTREMEWQIPYMIFTSVGNISSVVHAFQLGVFHYFQKPIPSTLLIESVNQCLAMSEEAHQLSADKQDAMNRLTHLTKSEFTVLGRLVQGKSANQVAVEFGISPQAVFLHRRAILKKLEIKNDVLLAKWVIQNGIELEKVKCAEEISCHRNSPPKSAETGLCD
jgi:FixJ family two-component response regulator